MTERNLVLTLADTEGLPEWLDKVAEWFETTRTSGAGVNLRLCLGQRELFGWRVTGISVTEESVRLQFCDSCGGQMRYKGEHRLGGSMLTCTQCGTTITPAES